MFISWRVLHYNIVQAALHTAPPVVIRMHGLLEAAGWKLKALKAMPVGSACSLRGAFFLGETRCSDRLYHFNYSCYRDTHDMRMLTETLFCMVQATHTSVWSPQFEH